MSGIAGIVRADSGIAAGELQSLLAVMRYRGLDDNRYWRSTNNSVGLCQAMTHTTPESKRERLPLQANDQLMVIAADVRLDNRHELLTALGADVSTHAPLTDCQLLLDAYRRWGIGCLQRLLGDFVFSLWDEAQQTLIVAMDPMGTRRLHYFCSNTLFAFATDIKALLTLPGIQKQLDEEGFLLHAATLSRVAQQRTCFAGIKKLTGGQYLSVRFDAFSTTGIYVQAHDYQRIEAAQHLFRRPEECLEAFREIFSEAIRCRMRSAFPLATLLSGGLDSSSISCIAARHARTSQQSLSAYASCLPPGTMEKDERKFIDLVARQEKIPVTYVSPTMAPVDFINVVHDMTESPLGANPHVYTALYGAARNMGARVLFDGLGGEWGPTNHGQGYLAGLLRQFKWLQLFNAIAEQARAYSRSKASVLNTEILRPLLPIGMLTAVDRVRRRTNGDSLPPLQRHMVDQFNIPLAHFARTQRALASGKIDTTRADLINTGRMPKDDFAAHFGIQSVYPFLDTRVLSFCLGLGPDWFVGKGWKRYFIRTAMEGVLPKEIQWRRGKKPFSPSYYRLMQASSKQYQAILSGVRAGDRATAYIDIDKIKRTIAELDKRGSWLPVNGKDDARVVVDIGVQAVVFLQWFDRV